MFAVAVLYGIAADSQKRWLAAFRDAQDKPALRCDCVARRFERVELLGSCYFVMVAAR
jgi:hypothetical protein